MKKRADGRYCKSITQNGKKLFFYSSAKTERQAIKEINEQILNYQQAKATSKSFADVAEMWENEHYPTVEYGSLKQYKPACKQCKDYFSDRSVSDIAPTDIDRFMQYLVKRDYAQKTIKTRMLVLNQVFKYAIINQYIDNNPCQYISIPKNLKKSTRDMPSESDLETVKNSIDKTFGLFAYFILYTGLRRGEALALTYDDIDFDNKVIHVNKSVYCVSNTPYIKSPKTEAGNRDVILLNNLAKVLKNTFPNTDDKTAYIFNNNGKLFSNSYFQCRWSSYLKETGLSITPHQLRHAYASILFDAGIDVKDAQELLGHASIEMTRDIYTHISKSHKINTMNKLNKFISSK